MKIYNVMHEESWVGTFYQGSFSTLEKAQEYINNIDLAKENFGDDDKRYYSIIEHEIDNPKQY